MQETKITLDNFFEKTEGTFKFIKEVDRNDVIFSSKRGIRLISNRDLRKMISEILNCEEKELKVIHVSYNRYFHTASFYLFKENSKQIIRVSEHWSDCNDDKVKICGSIRSCWWKLKVFKKDFEKIIGLKPKCRFYNYQIGVIKLNQFEPCERDEYDYSF